MEDELQTKHREKRNLMKDIKAISFQLRQLLPTLVYKTVLHQINLPIHSRVKFTVNRHERKLIKFRQQYHAQSDTNHRKLNPNLGEIFRSLF